MIGRVRSRSGCVRADVWRPLLPSFTFFH
jgi:hypothetical protein